MLTRRQKVNKRIFDITISIVLLPFALIPLILLLIVATISTGKNGLFTQLRIGKNGNPFRLYKIRTLKGSNHYSIADIKQHETRVGGWLRKHKIDEFPQLLNILKGDMSFVGPRPDVPGYANLLTGEDCVILSVRPGLTGPATIKYRNEDDLLMAQADPEKYNDVVIWPDKVEINKLYIKNWSFMKDIKYLLASIVN